MFRTVTLGWIALACLSSACEKRKGSLLPPRSTGETEGVAQNTQQMRAKALPEGTASAFSEETSPDEPFSELEQKDLQKVKQDAINRIKGGQGKPKLTAAQQGKAADLFRRARQLMASGQTEEARDYYLVSCQFGFGEACHKFGWHEEQSGNRANAQQFYKIACDIGVSKSCNNIGFLLEKQERWDEALDFYARACMDQHSVSCLNLKRLREERLKIR